MKLWPFLLLAGSCFGQSVIAPASTVNGVPATNLITICNTNPGSGTCSSLVSTYTDFTISTLCSGTNGPLSGVGIGCSNPGYSDQAGNIIAFAAAGQYWCQYQPNPKAIAYSIPCSTSGGTPVNLAAPGPIGGTTPGSGAFTTLSASGSATFSGPTPGNVTFSEPFGSTESFTSNGCETSSAATTLSTGGTTTDTGLSCLPATAVIDTVVYRITTTITTAASFTIGDGTIAARFCGTQSTLTAGTTGICFLQADQTGTSGPRQVSAAKVRVTTNANPGAGAIRLIVFYHTYSPPTS